MILFDHDADGVKTGTGWVKPDDGWLVLDRNDNGTIDSGRELFGVDTLKSNGQLASNGFDALKDLDANNDGKINSADSVFANLRIWRDLNQDGISQANELTTLGANNITAIGVNSSAVRADLGNGNVQTAVGTFTRSNGTTGTTGETNSATANLDLLVNTFYRQFSDKIPFTDQAKALPNLRGSGRVRDLSEAISLSTDLGNWVQTYTQQTTRQGQIDKLDGFIEKWANTADLKSLKVQADALSSSGVRLTYNLAGLTAGTPAYDEFIRKLGVVERFMGFTYGGANGQARFTPLDANSGSLTVTLAAEQIASISLAYDRFKTDIYESLLLQTRLGGYFDKLGIAMVDGRVVLDFQPVENAFKQAIASSPRDGIIDLVEFLSAAGETRFAELGWNATDFLITQLKTATDLGAFSEELSSWTVRFAASTEHNLAGTSRSDLMVASAGDDNIQGLDGNDILIGQAGNDAIDGGNGDDIVLGGAGNDSLSGGAGADTLDGGAGNDTLNGGYGNNTYLFGRGDGQDRVQYYSDAAADKLNTLQFKAGVAPGDIVLKQVYDNQSGRVEALEVSITGTSDKFVINGFFMGNNPYGAYNPVQQFKFADGTTWNMVAILDRLFSGTSVADTLTGTPGNDTLSGGAGNDDLRGLAGDDTLNGDEGNDYLEGGAGADTLDGGAGNDTLNGGYGNNTYLFGRGDGQDRVQYYSDAAADKLNTLQFKAGVAPGDIVLKQVYDNQSGRVEALEVSITGTSDKFVINGFFVGNNPYGAYNPVQQFKFADGTTWNMAAIMAKLSGGTDGADTLTGTPGNDTLSGGAGNDDLRGLAGDDTLNGDEGNDYLEGGAGADTLDGGAGNDTLNGGYGNNTYLFGRGDGQDRVQYYSDAAADKLNTLQFKAGVAPGDIVLKQVYDNQSGRVEALEVSITGTSDKFVINGFFVGNNPYGAYNPVQQFKFADGTTWNMAAIMAKLSGGTDGADTLTGTPGNDTLSGGAGNDDLRGLAGDDTLNGDEGNDYLEGGAGADTLDGGAGNDTLNGGYGNNTYLFGRGDGQDRVQYYSDAAADKLNTLQFKAGVAPGDIVLKQVYDNQSGRVEALEVSITGTSDKFVINGFFVGNNPYGAYNPVQQFKFADGTTWNMAAIMAKLSGGTDGADTLTGTPGNDTLSGGAGNDDLRGLAGDDTLNGDEGNDYLEGGAGADTLDGGAGNDTLNGGYGNNTYLFGRGDGQDRVQYYSDAAADKLNTLQFKAGVAPGDIVLKQVYDNQSGRVEALEVSITGTSDKFVINGFFVGNNPYGAYNPVQQFKFADGTTWNMAAIMAKLSGGTDGADTLTGTPGNDTLSGGAGNDDLRGLAGDDTLNGDEGNDYLEGGAGADTLDGGAGNDTLNGGYGNNTYLFGRGDGQDRVQYYSDAAADKLNTLQFKAGVAPGDIVLKQVYDNQSGRVEALEVSITGTSDKFVINGFFVGNNPYGAYNPVQQFKFADGTTWNMAAIMAKLSGGTDGADTLTGTPGNDTLSGGAGNDDLRGLAGDDTLNGDEGNDYLEGGAGADTLDGGAGNDTLNGGYGNNTYLFGRGDGQDRVQYYSDAAADKLNTLQFKAGVAPGDIVLKQVYDNQSGRVEALEVSITGTSDKFVINGFFVGNNPYGAYNPVQQFKFADGTTWNMAAIMAKLSGGTDGADTLTGTPGNDTLSGGAGNDDLRGLAGDDTLNGDEGNDYLEGGAGADTLDGGAGNDTLNGGYGNNTYLFGRGDGQDRVQYYSDAAADKLNTLQFKAGVAPGDIVLKQVYDNQSGRVEALEVSITGTADKFVINGFFMGNNPYGAYNPVQQFKFADGTTWNMAAIMAKLSGGTDGADTLTGTPGNDTLSGGAGNDDLRGLAGDDTLNGDEGNDYLEGGAGADTLDGGAGNDTLNGGNGNDTYVFGRGSGADSITDYDSTAGNTDCLSIGAGVATDQLWFRRVGADLEVSIIGTSDKSLINNWYLGDAYHIERFQTSDGKVLLDSQVNALVSAMAAFAPPPAGQTTLAADYQTALTPTLAAGWN
ncbi:beta strand repeat-containing protein [Verminephrobacter aporrectodeae]|uniref:beta strand repeat-containing protein n=11 Tax=Verminephrobacter aporrectodeae TaxID=1110389 RepID=UPI0022384719|nr:calcium-binding protein [Verminephrobacter aporrectodeae]